MNEIGAGWQTEWIDRTACAVCEGGHLETVREIGGIPQVLCSGCGFRQTGRLPGPAALARYYAQTYTGLRPMQGQRINADLAAHALSRMLGPARPASILDMGCGFGFLLDRLRRRYGAAVAGVEISEGERAHARDRLGLEVVADAQALGARRFDLVTAFEVIEHVPDPVAFLDSLAERLAPGGALVIGTDNFDCGIVRTMGADFPKWIPHQHVSLFDDRSIRGVWERMAHPVRIAGMRAYDPWELLVRAGLYRVSGGRVGGAPFRLDRALATEYDRPLRLYALRRMVNALWMRATLRPGLSGAMMFVLARRVS